MEPFGTLSPCVAALCEAHGPRGLLVLVHGRGVGRPIHQLQGHREVEVEVVVGSDDVRHSSFSPFELQSSNLKFHPTGPRQRCGDLHLE